MRQYKVKCEFYDSQDNNTLYKPGDMYPREGADIPDERIKSLASGNNPCRVPLIEEIKSRRSSYSDERNEDDNDRR